MSFIPLTCFPHVHWLLLAMNEHAHIDESENYVKQTTRNRYEILGVNGRIVLTVPVQGQKGQKIHVREIRIADHSWQRIHLRSIRAAYGRAAFFEHYFDGIEKIISANHTFLFDFNLQALEFVKGILNGSKVIVAPAMASSPTPNDYLQFEPAHEWPMLPPYPQVFGDRFGFVSNLSAIDLLMNKGPMASDYLVKIHSARIS